MKSFAFSAALLAAVLLTTAASAQNTPARPPAAKPGTAPASKPATPAKAEPTADDEREPAPRSEAPAGRTPASTGKPAPATKPAPGRPAPGRGSTSDKVIGSVEHDLDIFRDWVNDKLDRVDQGAQGARRELPRLKEEYDQQSSRIDRAVDSLTEQGKREYAGLKNRYETWQVRQERLRKEVRQPETATETQTRMLGENVVIGKARPSEIPDLYGRFIDYVRTNRRNWMDKDWAQANEVLVRLNQRYEQVREQIEVEERLRIRSWQAEFRTLEKARQTKDALE